MNGAKTAGEACGKVILLGEHAVVYGVPALAAGIERGVRAVAKPAAQKSSLSVKTWQVEVTEGDESELGRALGALVEVSGRCAPRAVEAWVDLPPGGGLGCSAALGVAVARAFDPAAPLGTVVDRVMAWERIFHGNPSGVDAAVASRGGCVLFSRESGLEEMRVGAPLTLCIGHTGEASSTARMVGGVQRLRADHPAKVEAAFDAIRHLVVALHALPSRSAIAARSADVDGAQSNMAHRALAISTPAIDRMCRLAREQGPSARS